MTLCISFSVRFWGKEKKIHFPLISSSWYFQNKIKKLFLLIYRVNSKKQFFTNFNYNFFLTYPRNFDFLMKKCSKNTFVLQNTRQKQILSRFCHDWNFVFYRGETLKITKKTVFFFFSKFMFWARGRSKTT